MHHPLQPLEPDAHGTMRFKPNKIVQHLLDHGGIDLNQIACLGFPQEDREQFAQLIGYSLSGFGDLSEVRDETYDTACKMLDGATEDRARIEVLEGMLERVREGLKIAVPAAFRLHPDDLHP